MIRGVDRVRDRDGVRAGSGCAILFEKHPPPPPEKKKVGNYLVGKN